MPSYHLQQFLTEVFEARGVPDPAKSAEIAVLTLVQVQVLHMADLDRFERDAKIYYLRGRGIMERELTARFGCSRATLYETIRRHGQRRRKVLKAN